MNRFFYIWFIMLSLLLIWLLPGLSEKQGSPETDLNHMKVSFEGVDVYNDKPFDINDLTIGDNSCFSKKIAFFSALLCAQIEDYEISVNNNAGLLLQQAGFDDIQTIDLEDFSPEQDSDDVTKFCLARKEVYENGHFYVVYAVVIQGTDTHSHWASNFDIGAGSGKATDDYQMITGEHPEWLDYSQSKGFDVTANRVMLFIDNYMRLFSWRDFGKEKNILITGHSRGGAIANIIGKNFEERKGIKSFTYTFAPAATTTCSQQECEKYKTIFNLINEDDVVTYVPLSVWGFRRYGQEIRAGIGGSSLESLWNEKIAPIQEKVNFTNDFNDELKSIFEEYLEKKESSLPQRIIDRFYDFIDGEVDLPGNEEYVSADGEKVAALVSKFADSREALYQKNKTSILYADSEDELKQNLLTSGLAPYCEIIEKTSDQDRNGFNVRFCPAMILKVVTNLLKKQEQMNSVFILMDVLLNEESGVYVDTIFDILDTNVIDGVMTSHRIYTYLLFVHE